MTGHTITCPPGVPAIEPYLARPRASSLMAQLDAIFFEASGTKTFASSEECATFRERWLGRYLAHDAQHAFLALAGADHPVKHLPVTSWVRSMIRPLLHASTIWDTSKRYRI